MATELSHLEAIERYIQQDVDGDSFYIGDYSMIKNAYEKFRQNIPRAEIFYAIKCNTNPELLEYLSKIPGIGFDCASLSEISLALNLSITKENIVFSNPCRGINHLKFAKKVDVKLLSFDGKAELIKIKEIFPEAELLIRIIPEDEVLNVTMIDKYGVGYEDSKKLLRFAEELNLNVVGVCFHVGSLFTNPNAYSKFIELAKRLFDFAKNETRFNFRILDIGGGFTDIDSDFEESKVISEGIINNSLNELFPETLFPKEQLRIIAEPGSFIVEKAFTLVASIMCKKVYSNNHQVIFKNDENEEIQKIMYYCTSGKFTGNFTSLIYNKCPPIKAAFTNGRVQVLNEMAEKKIPSIL